MEATAGRRREPAGKSARQRVLWVLLVVFVPLLSAAIMIAVALQIVGVPVWQSTAVFLHLKTPPKALVAPTDPTKSALAVQKLANESLTHQLQAVRQQLARQTSVATGLQTQVQKLQTQLATRMDAVAQAKQEAAVLVAMDPTQAALVLAKLPTAEAGQVVAAMKASDSGAILGNLDPATAGKLLSLAAADEQAASAASGSGTAANQTG